MYQRILVPVDGSPTSTRGLDEAVRLAQLTRGQLRLLHVLDQVIAVTGFETAAVYLDEVLPMLKQAGYTLLEQAKTRVDAAGVPVDTLLATCVARRTSEVINEQAEAWHADLIVLGTPGRRGAGRLLLGSDAEQVLRSAAVPVLLVRAPDDVPSVQAGSLADQAATAAARITTATL